ncbi:MAG: MerR family transcriptional regulator [Elusimicrobia bacterium]|nr:MerR family transcriptional regulator [Elusimicrobiota bacterium]
MEAEDKNFYSIGDVERITGIKAYILRYWEQEFRILRPARRTSGQRKYTRTDIDLILKIKELLYTKEYTIAGAKKFLIEERRKRKKQTTLDFGKESVSADLVNKLKKELKEILEILK